MADSVRAVLATRDRNLNNIIARRLVNDYGFEIAASVCDARAACDAVKDYLPSILLLDDIMPGGDAQWVIKRLMRMSLERSPRVVVRALPETSDISSRLLSKLADAVVTGDGSALARECNKALATERTFNQPLVDRRDEQITRELRRLKMPETLLGYLYLKTAIARVVDDISLLRALTTKLYPHVADVFGTTSKRVERSIRHAIERAWDLSPLPVLHDMFDMTIDPQRGKPTAGEFIAAIAERVRIKARDNWEG